MPENIIGTPKSPLPPSGAVPHLDVDREQNLMRRRAHMLSLSMKLLAQLNYGTTQNQIEKLVYIPGLDVLQGSVDETVNKISEYNNGRKIEHLRYALTIAKFYTEHDTVDLPAKIVVYDEDSHRNGETNEEKVYREKEKVLYYVAYSMRKKEDISIHFPASQKEFLKKETKKLIPPDMCIASAEIGDWSTSVDDASLNFSGLENILIAGPIVGKDKTVASAELQASGMIAILAGSYIGQKNDRITLNAAGDIIQEENSQNHAQGMECTSYYYNGGSISLTVDAVKSLRARIRIVCQKDFIKNGGYPISSSQVEIVDSHLPERQGEVAQRVVTGQLGISQGDLPQHLQSTPEERPLRRGDVLTVQQRQELFEMNYKNNLVDRVPTQDGDDLIDIRTYQFHAREGFSLNTKLTEFFSDVVAAKWHVESRETIEHNVLITVSRKR